MKLKETLEKEYKKVSGAVMAASKVKESEYVQLFFTLYKKIIEDIVLGENLFGSSTEIIKNFIDGEIKNKALNYTKEDIYEFAFALGEIQNGFSNNSLGRLSSTYRGLFLS